MTQAQVGQKVEETFRRFGSMINFIVLIIGALASVATVGSWKNTQETNDAKTLQWQLNHETYHRERLAENQKIIGSIETRLTNIERDRNEDRRVLDLTNQKLAGLEKAIDTVETNGAITTAALNKLSGDMQVVKEILTRIEKKQGG
ncbi:hypothetical protein ACQZ4Z_13085 [Agrobacterium vitis]|uniref:hypothetical protein n=1 Tax=Agrobacterium vitis TaxID=373 RepID=UPI0015744177|nr:hypothetical protein [Agrobacterium vitis]NSZ42848.1 hypothetical protein [Agrobacterium vitis]